MLIKGVYEFQLNPYNIIKLEYDLKDLLAKFTIPETTYKITEGKSSCVIEVDYNLLPHRYDGFHNKLNQMLNESSKWLKTIRHFEDKQKRYKKKVL